MFRIVWLVIFFFGNYVNCQLNNDNITEIQNSMTRGKCK